MTANKRIFLNIVATYGRSVYTLILGLLSARWILMSLGEVDYGLLGLVGGLASFVSFVNSLMASAVSRYYAFAVGRAKTDPVNGLVECNQWFNTALTIHAILPIILIVIGYPVGIWAIKNFLTIPPDRITACVWVWRFSCVSCFVSMASVPFNAMYTAKQEIAELTLYNILAATINFVFLCYMVSHPMDWLVRYAAWACFISVLPTTIIVFRAALVYSECRFNKTYLFDSHRVMDLFTFAAGRFICALALMIQGQGRSILVNKLLGPAKNTAMAIGQNLTSHATTLMFAMQGAYMPAITNAYGAGDYDLARKLCFRVCKLGTLSILIFAAPLIAESKNVLTIWLKDPPDGAAILCSLLLIEYCLSRLVDGHWMIVFANGKMAGFNATECVGYFIAFALMWIFMLMGYGIASIGFGAIACTFYTIPVKLYFARKFGGMSVVYWIKRVTVPLLVVAVVSIVAGTGVSLLLAPTLWRVVFTTTICEVLIFSLAWHIVFDPSEKVFLVGKAMAVYNKITRRG